MCSVKENAYPSFQPELRNSQRITMFYANSTFTSINHPYCKAGMFIVRFSCKFAYNNHE